MLSIIVTTLFITLLCNVILTKLNLPSIIGYIFTGTIIAYTFGLHDAVHNQDLKEIAEFGVVFLMFTIGLEFSFTHLKKMRYEVFVAGTLQISLTAFIVYILSAYVFGISATVSVIIAFVIALSSTAIVLKTFNDDGQINKRHGQRAFGILIMQDIAVIPILLLLGFLSNSDGDITQVLFSTFLNAVILLVILFVLGRFFLEKFFHMITKTKSDEVFVSSILFLAIASSYLAHHLGFSYSLGAFIAGMLIADTHYKYQAEADLVPFRDLLLGIFFITVGMQIDFSIIFEYLHIIALLLVSVMVLKFFIIYGIVRLRDTAKTSFKTALSLVQVGEFSLAVLELARSSDLIGAPHGQILIITIVISMILTPIILKNLTLTSEKIIKKEDGFEKSIYVPSHLENHVVILGFGEFGQELARAFKNQEENYIIVERDILSYRKGVEGKEPIIFGNAIKKNVLKHTHIKSAKQVIIAIDNPHKLYYICQTIQRFISNDKILVKVHSWREKKGIESLGIENILIENEQTSLAAVNYCQKHCSIKQEKR